jgi:hypothetical protein
MFAETSFWIVRANGFAPLKKQTVVNELKKHAGIGIAPVVMG